MRSSQVLPTDGRLLDCDLRLEARRPPRSFLFVCTFFLFDQPVSDANIRRASRSSKALGSPCRPARGTAASDRPANFQTDFLPSKDSRWVGTICPPLFQK